MLRDPDTVRVQGEGTPRRLLPIPDTVQIDPSSTILSPVEPFKKFKAALTASRGSLNRFLDGSERDVLMHVVDLGGRLLTELSVFRTIHYSTYSC